MPTIREIPVELGDRSYQVAVGVGVLKEVGRIAGAFAAGSPGRAVVITDSNVGPLYAETVVRSLTAAGLLAETIDFPAGEKHKNLATYGRVMDRLLTLPAPIDRQCLIVALGGGVVGDLAGFVAATALRGLAFVNVPTTLLAAVDASVGGKTGLDAPAGKNLIGAFHQPKAVIIDAAVLGTIGPAELGNGLAECVKHAVIRDASLLDFIEAGAAGFLAAGAEVLAELIARNVAIKAAVVAGDEREAGDRAHLNFGHTIGHAIETAAGYGVASHGQCVSLGMIAACRIAAARSLITAPQADRIRGILAALSLPVRFDDVAGLPDQARQPARLREIMAHDKKARDGTVRFILPMSIGSAAVFDDVTTGEIDAAVEALS